MLTKILTKIFGSRNERIINKFYKIVTDINSMEKEFEKLSDNELKNKTLFFKQRLSNGEKLNNLISEAFATVREASKRIFSMRHFDVQLIGGMVLNERCIAEMKTGEGKTLTATLPAYLNALSGNGVHIVTVNDYLAKRDAENNRPLFEFLGLTLGINVHGMSNSEKKAAYSADITYGTNNEYGFDYLRDNMIFSPEEKVQRTLHYAILDEVDSILIDEARTPLVISGTTENSSKLYNKINNIIKFLKRQYVEDTIQTKGNGHFWVDEKLKQIHLTENGLKTLEKLLVSNKILNKNESLYSAKNIALIHHVISALKANILFTKNVDYIIRNGEVLIIDEHTGRIMHGRRWSDGLHQAIEAKEDLNVQGENKTLASITFQNYFRLYEKLSGMTGTAETEAFEFSEIYNLETVIIPTNKPMIRKDMSDMIFLTERDKIEAIIKDIKLRRSHGQPVLIGTISIEKSELISKILDKMNIKHNVLNAKFHSSEARIISQAGKPGAVTIATNMAGRGTDIILGGSWKADIESLTNPDDYQISRLKKKWEKRNKKVISAGGLHIIGTERHESRRIDNQLRGRSGRQGDPGSSQFYLSMDDPLIRIFTSDKIVLMMKKLGMKPGESIKHPWVTKAIENAQKKIENRNFDIRKQLLEYDDITNEQRCLIYKKRNELLHSSNIQETIKNIRYEVLNSILDNYINNTNIIASQKMKKLKKHLKSKFSIDINNSKFNSINTKTQKLSLKKYIIKIADDIYAKKEQIIGKETIRNFEKHLMLQTLDKLWMEHLSAVDYLRQGIHLRGYAQKDPKQEYKRESFIMFYEMLNSLKYNVTLTLSKLQVH